MNLPAAPPSSPVTVERAPARPPEDPLLPPPNLENRLAIPPVKFLEISIISEYSFVSLFHTFMPMECP